jgi:hypothetical protein
VDLNSVSIRSRILRWAEHRQAGNEYRIRNAGEYWYIKERRLERIA